MIKIAGAAAIVISTAYIGFLKASSFEKRISALKLVVRMIEQVKILLNYSLLTTGEIIDKLSENNEFSSIVGMKNSGISCLSQYENQLLAGFWEQLGTTDLESQLSSAEMFKRTFEEDLSSLKEVKDSKCRLYRTMGILTGLFISVMLV